MQICDLSGPDPADPQEAVALADAITEAQRGFDIPRFTPIFWAVCKRCDRPPCGGAPGRGAARPRSASRAGPLRL